MLELNAWISTQQPETCLKQLHKDHAGDFSCGGRQTGCLSSAVWIAFYTGEAAETE